MSKYLHQNHRRVKPIFMMDAADFSETLAHIWYISMRLLFVTDQKRFEQITFILHIRLSRGLSYERSTASSKASSPHSTI